MQLRRGCRGWWIALLVAAADRVTKAAVVRFWDRPRLLDRTFEALIPASSTSSGPPTGAWRFRCSPAMGWD